FRKGDAIKVYPSGNAGTIQSIEVNNRLVESAYAQQSVVLHLNEDIDISRGDTIVKDDESLKIGQEIESIVCWMDEKPLVAGNKYLLQHNSKTVRAVVKEIVYKIDVNTLNKETGTQTAVLNEVALVKLKTASPLAYDSYQKLRNNGAAILIDETSYATSGACMFS
ncbi:MAG: sulfate adenylyltransferase, partial [Chitinophagaceae bacterium]|nr:sulfate adenylyltransferase [Chitinophagaceae bacterium]